MSNIFGWLIGFLVNIFLWSCFTFAVVNTLHIGIYWNCEVNLNEWLKLVVTGLAYLLWYCGISKD